MRYLKELRSGGKARLEPFMFVGVDGCGKGWFTVILKENNGYEVNLFENVKELYSYYNNAALILIDIPIGLREKGNEERCCDKEARKLLGKRASSIFPAPCRPAIHADTYEEAKKINKKNTGRKMSYQTWNIIRKIRDVDELLLKDKSARLRIKEIHPEICFWALANKNPMEHSKRTEEGFKERKQVLHSIFHLTNDIINDAESEYKRNEVARDDILDALSAAVTAMLGINGTIPKMPQFDSHGLPMEMVYHVPMDFHNSKSIPQCPSPHPPLPQAPDASPRTSSAPPITMAHPCSFL